MVVESTKTARRNISSTPRRSTLLGNRGHRFAGRRAILVSALADRLAEAFAERLHERVRREFWGYAPDENLSNEDLMQEKYRGIRPAPGYPACPDHTEKGTLFDLLQPEEAVGSRLAKLVVPSSCLALGMGALRNLRAPIALRKLCSEGIWFNRRVVVPAGTSFVKARAGTSMTRSARQVGCTMTPSRP